MSATAYGRLVTALEAVVKVAQSRDGSAVGKARNIPPWQCPGPSAGEFRCEAKQPNSALDLCDECWAAR